MRKSHRGPLRLREGGGERAKNTLKRVDSRGVAIFSSSSDKPEDPNIFPRRGGTPTLRTERLEEMLRMTRVFVKNESRNPTLSFKDRKSTVSVSKASEFGARAMACMTAGNAGSSIAAYAAKAQIPAYIFTIGGISDSKMAKLLFYGAHVFRTSSPTRDLMVFVREV